MPPIRTARRRVVVPAVFLAVGALVAAPFAVQAAKQNPVSASTASAADSTAITLPSVGRVESCVLDKRSGCTVLHGFGKKPVAITAIASGPVQLSIDPGKTTDKSYRLHAVRRDGKNYRQGTKLRYTAHYDFVAAPAQPPTPKPTPMPTKPPTATPKPTVTPKPTITPPTKPPTTKPPTAPPTSNPGQTCTKPGWTTTAKGNQGEGRTYGQYYVHNNMWNNHNGTYTMAVCNYNSWYEDVTQSRPGDNGVQAYPNVHKDYNDFPLAKIQSAKFAATAPSCSGCIYNVAFDVWINEGFENELMIWTQNSGQTPAGDKLGTTTIGGHAYEVWKTDGANKPGGIFTYKSVTTQTSGTMPLQAFFKDLEARKWIPAKSTTWQVDYGVEVVSTNNTKQRFTFNAFEIQES
ncbi:hypothetical protein E1263_22965 [Kribbella antibiotica]|uniref:Glycosyl hydrolase family 12 n=1 Tax=Kribbella antibiotica TaxID=190195 RepID=A0A4R4ZLD6_9ACTN|nr:hypothetical protein [Kribbella antibiotica]TDD57622.1 hypothetical protein E1263_22965 [Kribbella antibiotica]